MAADCNIHKLVLPQIVRILHIEVIRLLPSHCLAWSCCRCSLYLFTSFVQPLHNVFLVPDISFSLRFLNPDSARAPFPVLRPFLFCFLFTATSLRVTTALHARDSLLHDFGLLHPSLPSRHRPRLSQLCSYVA